MQADRSSFASAYLLSSGEPKGAGIMRTRQAPTSPQALVRSFPQNNLRKCLENVLAKGKDDSQVLMSELVSNRRSLKDIMAWT